MSTDTTSATAPQADPAAILDGATETSAQEAVTAEQEPRPARSSAAADIAAAVTGRISEYKAQIASLSAAAAIAAAQLAEKDAQIANLSAGATETAGQEAAPGLAEHYADPGIALLRMRDEIARMIGREIERATSLTAAGGRLPSARCEHIQAVAALATAAAAIRTANALERIADAQEETVNMIR